MLATSLAAAATLFALAPGGMPTYNSDSVVFTDAATNVREGNGYVLSARYPGLEGTHVPPRPQPLLHWGPVWPTVLAGLGAVGVSYAHGALAVQATLSAATVALGALIARRIGAPPLLALVTGAAMGWSAPAIDTYLRLSSEPLFTVGLLASIALAVTRTGRATGARLALAAVIAGLCVLTRYAGLPVVGIMALLAAWPDGDGGIRWRRGITTGAIGGGIVVSWLAVSQVTAGSGTGRVFTFEPIPLREWFGFLGSLTRWLTPPGPVPLRAPIAAALLLLAAAGLRRRRVDDAASGWAVAATAGVSLALLGFLFVTMIVLDAASSPTTRLIGPAEIVAVPLVVVGVHAWFAGRFSSRVAATAVAALVAGMATSGVAHGLELRRGEGENFWKSAWRRSPTLTAARRVEGRIASNAPDLLFLRGERLADSVPPRIDPLSLRPNPGYVRLVRALRRDLARGEVTLVWFDPMQRAYLPSLDELVGDPEGLCRRELPDGWIVTAAGGQGCR